jgi:hypothetical protein
MHARVNTRSDFFCVKVFVREALLFCLSTTTSKLLIIKRARRRAGTFILKACVQIIEYAILTTKGTIRV